MTAHPVPPAWTMFSQTSLTGRTSGVIQNEEFITGIRPQATVGAGSTVYAQLSLLHLVPSPKSARRLLGRTGGREAESLPGGVKGARVALSPRRRQQGREGSWQPPSPSRPHPGQESEKLKEEVQWERKEVLACWALPHPTGCSHKHEPLLPQTWLLLVAPSRPQTRFSYGQS